MWGRHLHPGEAVRTFGMEVLKLDKKDGAAFTAIVMVFLGAFFTGLGVYDVLGELRRGGLHRAHHRLFQLYGLPGHGI